MNSPPAAPGTRKLALQCLQSWRKGSTFAENILRARETKTSLAPAESRFLRTLFYGVLQNRTLLDHWIDSLTTHRLSARTRDILRLGLYQLFTLDIPDYAALDQSVALAPRPQRGLINAILRRATREKEALQEKATAAPLAIRTSHPPKLIARWEKQYGPEQTAALCAWNQQPPTLTFRLNLLHPEAAALEIPAHWTPHPFDSRFFTADRLPLELLQRGLLYAQDPSTALAVDLLDPQADETILDACAAPGGKSALIAQKMQNRGQLLATDSQPHRLERLRENLQRLHVAIATTRLCDWTKPPTENLPLFDKILLDAPCSNTGVMRRRIDVRWRLQSATWPELARLQSALLDHLLPHLRPGGHLVYSTCSIEAEENQGRIATWLERHPELELESERQSLPTRDKIDGAYAARIVKKSAL